MENFISSFGIVLPLFLFMAVGYLLRRVGLIDDNFASKLSRFIYRFAMPVMITYNLYSSDLKSEFDGKIIIYAIASTAVLITLLWIVVPRVVSDRAKAGVIIQAIFRSNFMLFAVHIMKGLYPKDSLGMTLVLVAVMTITYNFAAVIVLSAFGCEQGNLNFKKALLDILTNPLIIGSVVGVVLSLTGVKFGTLIDGTFSDIAGLGTPLALITLGGQFKFTNAKKNVGYIISGCVGRLIAVPAVFIGIAILLGFRGMDLSLVLAMSASPAAVSSYIMASQAGCDGKLAGEIVVFSSAFSVFTIFAFVFLLKSFALI